MSRLHTEAGLIADLNKRIKKLESQNSAMREEIYRLRSLEDSYDTQENIMSEVFLTLNRLCSDKALQEAEQWSKQ